MYIHKSEGYDLLCFRLVFATRPSIDEETTRGYCVRLVNDVKVKSGVRLPEIAGVRTPMVMTMEVPTKTKISKAVLDLLFRSIRLLKAELGKFLVASPEP